jgi:hypothetical protein
MAFGTRHITLFVTLFALAGCGADAGDAASGATVASEHERVTGGTSGDPPPLVYGTQDQPFQGCEFRTPDGYTIQYESQIWAAMDGFCSCPEQGTSLGRLRNDDPNLPQWFVCRAPFACFKISFSQGLVTLPSNPSTVVYAQDDPCNCPSKNITWGKMERDDPNAPSTFYCRVNRILL